MDEAYHFERIHDAQPTADGEHIHLTVTGAQGPCALSIPTADTLRGALLLLQAVNEARRRSGKETIQAPTIQELRVLEPPGELSYLLATLQTGSAPVALGLTQAQLVDFARSVLQRRGLLPVESGPSSQRQ